MSLQSGHYIEFDYTLNNPVHDGKTVAETEKLTIADTDHPSDPWYQTEILGGFDSADIEYVYSLTNDAKFDLVGVHSLTHIWTLVLN